MLVYQRVYHTFTEVDGQIMSASCQMMVVYLEHLKVSHLSRLLLKNSMIPR